MTAVRKKETNKKEGIKRKREREREKKESNGIGTRTRKFLAQKYYIAEIESSALIDCATERLMEIIDLKLTICNSVHNGLL